MIEHHELYYISVYSRAAVVYLMPSLLFTFFGHPLLVTHSVQ